MSYWLTGSFTEEVSHLHAKIPFILLKPNILVSQPLHSTQRVMCSPAREQAARDYVPWAATSVASCLFSVSKVGCSDPKKDLAKDGQKPSLKGVWREKESSRKGKHSSVRFQMYQVPIICLHFAHTLFNQSARDPGSLPAGMQILTICPKCSQKLQLKWKSTSFFNSACVCIWAFFPPWNNYNLWLPPTLQLPEKRSVGMAVVTGLGFYTILAITGWLQGPHETVPVARHGKYSCPRHRSLQISAEYL